MLDLDAEAIRRILAARAGKYTGASLRWSVSTPAECGWPSACGRAARRCPVGILDVSFYRDDFSRSGLKPDVRPSQITFDVGGSHILLVDDVLNTGRTVRAAMNEIFDYGRPARIDLAVLVDRGGRELPIAATVVGATLEVPADISVVLTRDDDQKLHLTMENRGGE
jgi:pyrimidine operon attenuation protein/uracil phosphoribosyltransferase